MEIDPSSPFRKRRNVTPLLKEEKRVGRIFRKNLEAKPLFIERRTLASKENQSNGRKDKGRNLNARHSKFWSGNLPTL